MTNELAVFQDRIRKMWHEGEYWFSVTDVVAVLTDSPNPRNYWAHMKRKVQGKEFRELLDKVQQLKLQASDGKTRLTDCADEATAQAIMHFIPWHAGQKQHRGHVYAIQAIGVGLVKLGYTAKDVSRRLETLRLMSPVPLTLIWNHAATPDDELLLHKHFASYRRHGEWFDLRGLDIPYELSTVLASPDQKEEKVS
jgi:hypothetical protein